MTLRCPHCGYELEEDEIEEEEPFSEIEKINMKAILYGKIPSSISS